MILLFRSNNIFDSRVNKYHNYYERAGLDYTIVGWDRKGEGWQRERYDFFRYRAGEAEGGAEALSGASVGSGASLDAPLALKRLNMNAPTGVATKT